MNINRLTRSDPKQDLQDGGYYTIITNSKGQVRKQKLNALNQVTEVKERNNGVTYTTSYAYTPHGYLHTTTDPNGNIVSIEYDILGRKVSIDDPDMGIWTYTYNAFGDLVGQTDAKGNTVQMSYDTLGRIKSRAVNGQEYTWEYDTRIYGIGKPGVIYGLNGYTQAYIYDTLSRLKETTTVINGNYYVVTNDYDSYGRLLSVTYPQTSLNNRLGVKYVYDANNYGFLRQVQNLANSALTYWSATSRNALGQVLSATLGNGLVSNWGYDAATGRITTISTQNGSTNIQQDSYVIDALGNLSSRSDGVHGRSESFTYDDLNRLKTATVSDQAAKTYDYDALGNIISKSDNGGTYAYERTSGNPLTTRAAGPHAVTLAGGIQYYYDKNGNLLYDSRGREFEYNGFNRPISVTQGSTSADFVYDEADLLITQTLTQGSTTTTMVYIGDLFEKITSNNGAPTEYKHYIKAAGETIAIYTEKGDGSSNTRYLHKDHLGSIAYITTETSALAEDGQLSYDPWGKRRNASTWADQATVTSASTDRGFTGHLQLDTLGLIHMKGRIYDPVLARFTSPDPFVQDTLNPQCLNRYSYCLNNPLSLTDPSGYWSWRAFAKGFCQAAVFITVFTAVEFFSLGTIDPIDAATIAGMSAGAVGALFDGTGLEGAFIGACTGGLVAGINASFNAFMPAYVNNALYSGELGLTANEIYRQDDEALSYAAGSLVGIFVTINMIDLGKNLKDIYGMDLYADGVYPASDNNLSYNNQTHSLDGPIIPNDPYYLRGKDKPILVAGTWSLDKNGYPQFEYNPGELPMLRDKADYVGRSLYTGHVAIPDDRVTPLEIIIQHGPESIDWFVKQNNFKIDPYEQKILDSYRESSYYRNLKPAR